MKTDKKLISTGLLAAFTASLCCITPLLAFIAGTSGLATTFSWLEPLRPYLIGLTIFVLGFAWYLKLKPKKQLDCSCEKDEKIPFTQSKMFLGIITLFAVVMLAFPYYSGIFYPTTEKQIIIVDQSNIREIEFTISGMTCASCGEHVNSEVNKLTGIISSDASYENKNAVVKFDDSKTNIDEIENAINGTGYVVTAKKEYQLETIGREKP
ncbi:mercuric transport protein MerTP [Cloacibacterium caeni]|uniref:mercuric transport protein MerTP n=1 Tax=Cloacibacterium caeni TaxID=2004710 RepID=UPI001BCE915A|nr:mercuric transport protein MerTP [Cloacibacterium caeni]